jgi:hypothetical protein
MLHTREVAGSKPAAPILWSPCTRGGFVVCGGGLVGIGGRRVRPRGAIGAQSRPDEVELKLDFDVESYTSELEIELTC